MVNSGGAKVRISPVICGVQYGGVEGISYFEEFEMGHGWPALFSDDFLVHLSRKRR